MDNIDHDQWMGFIATVWEALSLNGLTPFILNVMVSFVLLAVLARFSTKRKSA